LVIGDAHYDGVLPAYLRSVFRHWRFRLGRGQRDALPRLTGLGHVTVALVEYHTRTAEKAGQAIEGSFVAWHDYDLAREFALETWHLLILVLTGFLTIQWM
jgi:hypothetical protein